jgi:hypothetical protein
MIQENQVGLESKFILELMILCLGRNKNVTEKNPEAQLHAGKET